MKILADENIPIASILILEKHGYDVLSIGRDFFGIQDSEVIQLAIEQERLIITFDRDYGTLVFKNKLKPQKGVIYFRIDEISPEFVGYYFIELMENRSLSFENKITVVSNSFIRQKSF